MYSMIFSPKRDQIEIKSGWLNWFSNIYRFFIAATPLSLPQPFLCAFCFHSALNCYAAAARSPDVNFWDGDTTLFGAPSGGHVEKLLCFLSLSALMYFNKNNKCVKDKMTSPTWIALFGLFIQWFSTRSSWYFWLGWKVGSGHEILWLSFAYYGTLTKRANVFERPRRKATRNPGPKEQQMPSYLVILEIMVHLPL